LVRGEERRDDLRFLLGLRRFLAVGGGSFIPSWTRKSLYRALRTAENPGASLRYAEIPTSSSAGSWTDNDMVLRSDDHPPSLMMINLLRLL
jgi:hypothetical protein